MAGMGIFDAIRAFFARLFSKNPEDARNRAALKRVAADLERRKPPYYRLKSNVVLPGFAQTLFTFYGALKPLAEIVHRSLGHGDVRVAQRFFDHLIDARVSEERRQYKMYFSYEGMLPRVRDALRADDEFETLNHEFQAFIREAETLAATPLNRELADAERFVDLCRHDWEHTLGLFDPGVNVDDPSYLPDFSPCEGEQVVNEILDVHFLVDSLAIDQALVANLSLTLEKLYPQATDLAARKAKIAKIAQTLERFVRTQLDPETLLALCRACKHDPGFVPSTPRERKDYINAYKNRLVTLYEKDRERIRRELHETAIVNDIETLFGDSEILEVDGYDEQNDLFLQRESPYSFTHIKPLRIIKTFIYELFDKVFKEHIKRLLVEGYFDNKQFQNNLANILFQCEKTGPRIFEFEAMLKGNSRTSVATMRRFVEEMRRGKDIQSFLEKLVDYVNLRAREIVEEETGLLSMLSQALGEIMADFRKASPELISNIRILGGGRNREIMGQVQKARDSIDVLVKIVRNFAIVKTPGQPGIDSGAVVGSKAQEPQAPSPPSDLPDMPDA
jgi:hypothetical protein